MKVKIGVDFDGTITLSCSFLQISMRCVRYKPFGIKFSWPWWFFFLQPWLFFPRANKAMVEELRKRKKTGDEIIIVSARPRQAMGLTRRWLKRNDIPFDHIFHVGGGQGMMKRKLAIINEEGIVIFYDDTLYIRQFLKERGVEVKPPPTNGYLAQWLAQ